MNLGGYLSFAALIIATIGWPCALINYRRTVKATRRLAADGNVIKPSQWGPILPVSHGTMIVPGLPAPASPATEKGWRAPPVDSTLGWRGWYWNAHERCLQSPAYHALWRDGECRVEQWSKDDAVRGVAGIHAVWPVPKDWQSKPCAHAGEPIANRSVVTGIVERYGHYVLGEDGWRAEWVVVRELAAHKDIIEEVRKAYPGITVHERVVAARDPNSILAGGTLVTVASGSFWSTSAPGILFFGAGGGGMGGGGPGLSLPAGGGQAMYFSSVSDPNNWDTGPVSGLLSNLGDPTQE